MDFFNLIAGASSMISLAFAFYMYHKNSVAKAREEGNIRVFFERLRNIKNTLKSAGTTTQILIRRADYKNVEAVELQNLGRAIRANIYSAMLEAKGFDENLQEWKFGFLVKSKPVSEEDENENDLNDKKIKKEDCD